MPAQCAGGGCEGGEAEAAAAAYTCARTDGWCQGEVRGGIDVVGVAGLWGLVGLVARAAGPIGVAGIVGVVKVGPPFARACAPALASVVF